MALIKASLQMQAFRKAATLVGTYAHLLEKIGQRLIINLDKKCLGWYTCSNSLRVRLKHALWFTKTEMPLATHSPNAVKHFRGSCRLKIRGWRSWSQQWLKFAWQAPNLQRRCNSRCSNSSKTKARVCKAGRIGVSTHIYLGTRRQSGLHASLK